MTVNLKKRYELRQARPLDETEPMPLQDVVDESDGKTEEHPVANLPKRERKFKYRGTTLNHKQCSASVKEIQRW